MRTRTDEMNDVALRTPLRLRARWEPAPGGGWDCYDATAYDGAPDASRRASVSGHGDTKPEAFADLIAALEAR